MATGKSKLLASALAVGGASVEATSPASREPMAETPQQRLTEIQRRGTFQLPGRVKAAPVALLDHALAARASANLELEQQLSLAKGELAKFEGVIPTKKIHPKEIGASQWANRVGASFEDAEFIALKDEIASAGGNVQPIKVRRTKGSEEGIPPYEIVFGHRRHRACLELDLPVLAMIEDDLSDVQLFCEMERENREQKRLSPFEQGRMYARALSLGLFENPSRLASEIEADPSNVRKALRLASLPEDVISAFPSENDLQYRWEGLLSQAISANRDAVIERCKQVRLMSRRPSAKETLRLILEAAEVPPDRSSDGASRKVSFQSDGKAVGKLVISKGGRVSLEINPGVLSAEREHELEQVLRSFLER